MKCTIYGILHLPLHGATKDKQQGLVQPVCTITAGGWDGGGGGWVGGGDVVDSGEQVRGGLCSSAMNGCMGRQTDTRAPLHPQVTPHL